eukprot:COSAG02_NODE_28417_length_590_cov_0.757637_1_plen_179_part_10
MNASADLSLYQNLSLRLANDKDIKQLSELSQATQPGLTSMPKSEQAWQDRINIQKKWFTFVLEDERRSKIIGTASILDKVSTKQPLYVYQIQEKQHVSSHLQIQQNMRFLCPKKIEHGPSELGALWLHPQYRGLGLGRFLTAGRLFFMATYPDLFQDELLAELRGYADKEDETKTKEKP